jgi:hypothetical protein
MPHAVMLLKENAGRLDLASTPACLVMLIINSCRPGRSQQIDLGPLVPGQVMPMCEL